MKAHRLFASDGLDLLFVHLGREISGFVLDLLIKILDQLAPKIPGRGHSEKNEGGRRHRGTPEGDPSAQSPRLHPAPRRE